MSGPLVLASLVLVLATSVESTQAAQCGNGIREGAEACDGADVGGLTCENFCGEAVTGDGLRCSGACAFLLSGCQICGNDVREGTEVCDGSDLAGTGCPGGGALLCDASCRAFDTNSCWECGNGRRDEGAGEECDGTDFGPDGSTCDGPGETGGPLICTAECRFNRSLCRRCGNGRVEPGEGCDDGNLVDGDGCSATCTDECGDGVVERGEECDDGNLVDGDGCEHLCHWEHRYAGGGEEAVDACLVQWTVAQPTPPAASIACLDGDSACDRGTAVGTCDFLVFHCLNSLHFPLGPNPPCWPTTTVRIELRGASVSGPTALGPAAENAVLDALATTLKGWGGSSVTRMGRTLTAAPPLSTLQCGSFRLSVPVGAARSVVVRAVSGDLSPAVDDDELTFACHSP
jgi:cysteine-rich repeat protein